MALNDLEGIANVTFSLTETVTWGTAADWDGAVSQDFAVVHESAGDLAGDDVVQLGHPSTDTGLMHSYLLDEAAGASTFADFTGSNPLNNNGATAGETGVFGGKSVHFNAANTDYLASQNATAQNFNDATIVAWVRTDGTPDDFGGILATDTVNDNPGYVQTAYDDQNNPGAVQMQCNDGSNGRTEYSTQTINDGAWHLVGFIYDNSADDIEIVIDGSRDTTSVDQNQNPGTIGLTEPFYVGAERGLVRFWDGWICWPMFWNEAKSVSFVEGMYPPGHITVGTKSFGTTTKPDLQSLVYSLNGGSISLDVIGSPGTASEETVTQALGGATSYDLTWSNSHQDFRFQATLDTPDLTATPTMSQVELTTGA